MPILDFVTERKCFLPLFLLIAQGWSQSNLPAATPATTPTISDNSFLVEEAYNQEYGVVQHIQTFTRLYDSGDWAYTFTQEWPVDVAPRNQLSYTLVAAHAGAFPRSGGGFGDLFLNYRYQVTQTGRFAFAPRISLIVPSGDSSRGRGGGGSGVQFSLPFSLRLTPTWVTHFNAGATVVPHAKGATGARAATNSFNLGHSLIWQPKPRFNVTLETVYAGNESVIGPGQTQRNYSLLMSPGVRWAYNFKNGMQIVPGIAVPVGVGPSRGEAGIPFYLSIEHPYRKARESK